MSRDDVAIVPRVGGLRAGLEALGPLYGVVCGVYEFRDGCGMHLVWVLVVMLVL